MKLSPDKSHAYCERQACHVPLDRTEGQCRDDHACSDETCPLEKEFGRPRFGRALAMMAAGMGQVVSKLG